MEVLNQARITRGRIDYESVGTATMAELTELREEVEKLLPVVGAFLRSRDFELT